MQIQFVADLFDEKVTKESIMNGLDSLDIEKFGKSYGTVFWDSQKKMMKKQKAMTEEI